MRNQSLLCVSIQDFWNRCHWHGSRECRECSLFDLSALRELAPDIQCGTGGWGEEHRANCFGKGQQYAEVLTPQERNNVLSIRTDLHGGDSELWTCDTDSELDETRWTEVSESGKQNHAGYAECFLSFGETLRSCASLPPK